MPIPEEQLGPLIEQSGYKYVDGSPQGAGALWQAGKWDGDKFTPDKDPKTGGVFTQEQIVNQLFPSSSPYLAANNRTPAGFAPDRTSQVGIDPQGNRRFFTNDAQGQPIWGASAPETSSGLTFEQQMALKQTPSFSVSQSIADPQSIAIQMQQLQLQQQQIDEQIRQNQANQAIANATLDFQKSKEAFAQETTNKTLAQQAKVALQQNAVAVAGLQLQQAGMVAQRDALQAQMAQQTALANFAAINDAARTNAASENDASKFNATMGFNVEQANRQAEIQRQAQLQQLAESVATAGADAGDRGKLAGLLLANRGWGEANTALADADLRTTQSTAPLESLLRTREDVQNQPKNPFTYTPITAATYNPTLASAPNVSPLDLSRITIPQAGGGVSGGGGGGQMVAQSPQAVTDYGGNLLQALMGAGASADSAGGFASIAAQQAQAGVPQAEIAGFPKAAHGGQMDGAYISGERGPEINIPLGNGQALVLNQQQAAQHGIDIRQLMAAGQPNYQDGGVFSGFGNVQDTDRTRSFDFLNQASGIARAGTPFAQGTLPTPVYASSPGFNPVVAKLLASISAQAQGIPADFWLSQASMYRPAGINERAIARSA